jgi:hypothetical protein
MFWSATRTTQQREPRKTLRPPEFHSGGRAVSWGVSLCRGR